MTDLTLELPLKVNSFDCDLNKKLKPDRLFGFFQEIAYQHADVLGFGISDFEPQNLFWVLSKAFLDIKKMPEWGENIVVKTWPKGVKSFYGMRDFEVLNTFKKPIITATSYWAVINSKTHRPVKPESIKGTFPEHNKNAYNSPQEKISKNYRVIEEKTFNIPYFAIDLSQHTNNTYYIEQACNLFKLQFPEYIISKCSFEFRSETKFNDKFTAAIGKLDDKNIIVEFLKDSKSVFAAKFYDF